MFNGRIKGTHIPRLVLAVIALTLFFVALGYKLVKTPIDFTQPGWAIVMVGFLLLGILMLLTSWVLGLDTRAEIFITLFMLILHICFDAFIFVQVFILQRDIPVFLVQAVVQAYWIAGLLDVVLMYWAHNWQRTASTYVSPEQENAQLKQERALLEHRLSSAEQRLSKTEQMEAQREQELARTYTEVCPICSTEFEHQLRASAQRALRAHMGRAHTNGHIKEMVDERA